MKARNVLAVCLFMGIAATANAQEYDDMYFNSSDRAAWKTSRAELTARNDSKKKFEATAEKEWNNPTDSYSARNVNPEYISREKTMSAQEDEKDYFIENYDYVKAAQYDSWNNSFNNWYANSWYSPGFYGSSFNRWSSPYYYGYSDPWYDPYMMNDPWMYPYSPYSYRGMSSWGWGMGMGLSYTWGNPYYGGYCPYGYGMAGNPWLGSWYGGRNVVIVNNGYNGYENARPVSVQKRPSRSSSYDDPVRPSRGREAVTTYPTWGRSEAGGRSSNIPSVDRTTRQESYYNKNWRGASQGSPTRSSTNSSWSEWDSPGTQSSGYSTPSRSYNSGRSSSSPSYSPPASSGSRSSGSGSNGRTRGRD